jgi:enoyl-CoA hydratase/carnithine racemase
LMFMTGRRIKPDQALDWGLVDEVVPAEQLLESACTLAREIAENAPLAVEETRRTLRGDLAGKVRAQTDHELEQQFKLIRTEDFAEGVRAVNERRPGVFVGR